METFYSAIFGRGGYQTINRTISQHYMVCVLGLGWHLGRAGISIDLTLRGAEGFGEEVDGEWPSIFSVGYRVGTE